MNEAVQMSATGERFSGEHRYRGMLQILRFNWPWYAAVLVLVFSAWVIFPRLNVSVAIKGLLAFGVAAAFYWSVASLLASHWVYDLSALTKWDWMTSCLPALSGRSAMIHCGFDESEGRLGGLWPESTILAWDIYRPDIMTEGSIARARHNAVPTLAATSVDLAKLPERDNALDAAFLIFAAHEIRGSKDRDQFFRELSRVLKPGGTVLLVEHLRDWQNFLAYGPGFAHFLREREWLRLAKEARFNVAAQFRITPFVLILKLTKPLRV